MSYTYYIYLFKEKETDKIIYVGKTNNLNRRLSEHVYSIENKETAPIYQYINSKGYKLFLDILVCIVDSTNYSEIANELEKEYTAKYNDTVLNVCLGDDKSGKYSPKSKKIRCLNDGKVYNGLFEVKQAYPNLTNLSNHLNHRTRLKNGLVFEYIKSSSANDNDAVWIIKCLDDGNLFSSFKSCADYYGISKDVLYHKGKNVGDIFTVGTAGKGNQKCNKLTFMRLGRK